MENIYTIKKSRSKGTRKIYEDTYTLQTGQLYEAQIMFLDIVRKESEWMLNENIVIEISLHKNDEVKNTIKLTIKNH